MLNNDNRTADNEFRFDKEYDDKVSLRDIPKERNEYVREQLHSLWKQFAEISPVVNS